jgi:Ca2+-binding RTX toxin-like protein
MSGRVGDHDNGDIWNDAFQFEVRDGEQFSLGFTASTTPGAELMVFRSDGSGGWEYQGDGSTPFTGGGTYLAKVWTDNSGGADYQLRADLTDWNTSHSYDVSDNGTPVLSDSAVTVDIQRQYGDEITGSDSGEILLGGSGDDALLAQGGDDVLVGGGGDDTLTGGGGGDMFLFTATTDGHDTITDFSSGEDTINLDALFDSLGVSAGDRVVDAETVGSDTVLRVGTESGGVFTDGTGGAFSVTVEGASLSDSDVDALIDQGAIVVDES